MTTEYLTDEQRRLSHEMQGLIYECTVTMMGWDVDRYDGPRGSWLSIPFPWTVDDGISDRYEWWVFDLRQLGGPTLGRTMQPEMFAVPVGGSVRVMPGVDDSDDQMDRLVGDMRADGWRYFHPTLIEMFDRPPIDRLPPEPPPEPDRPAFWRRLLG